jgi:RNA polymerase sigma-70 factor (ECF subfamily)
MADPQLGAQLVQRALAGETSAHRPLVDVLGPVVHARVARAVLRSGSARKQGRDLRQEVEDLVQEVFVALFADDARALRSWDPARGMSLVNFVGLVAEHQVASILRSGRRNPWTEEPTVGDAIDRSMGATEAEDERVHSREVLGRVLDRLRSELSPRGMMVFQMLVVEERGVEEVCTRAGMTPDAVYAWRSRFGKLARRLAAEITASGGASDPAPPRRIPEREDRKAP